MKISTKMKSNYNLFTVNLLLTTCAFYSIVPNYRILDSNLLVNAQALESDIQNSPVSGDDKLTGDEPTSFFREQSLTKTFDQRVSFDQYINYAMRALALVAGFDNDLHRYDNKQDLIDSFVRNHSISRAQNAVRSRVLSKEESDLLADQSESTLIEHEHNQMNCGDQLDLILNSVSKLLASSTGYSRSKQLSLIDYLDSFGGPAALMQGNFLWLGSPKQCAEVELSRSSLTDRLAAGSDEDVVKTRYCIANFRSPDWLQPQQDKQLAKSVNHKQRLGNISMKLGICLPRSCNSLSYYRHAGRVESLAKLVRLDRVPLSSYKLTHLFCLPDESSPLRQFSMSARVFILLLSGWITVLIYVSLKYEYKRMKWLAIDGNSPAQFDRDCNKIMKIFSFRLGWSNLFASSAERQDNVQVLTLDIDERDSPVTRTLDDSTDRSSAKQQDVKTSNIISALKRQSHLQKDPVNVLPPSLEEQSDKSRWSNQHRSSVVVVNNQANNQAQYCKSKSLDLSVVEGIKVLSMVWLIGGHTLLFFIRTIANGRDFWSLLREARFMTIMAGIFPVDTFFTITGILTAYLKFNKNNGRAMSKLSYWLEAFVHRYMRFMPMYLIIFWYTRDVSEYIGSGPLWDYATADTSLRSTCKRESFFVPLLFQANFKPIDQHCVKPAWYLANDYQYLLITPLFMTLIMKSTLIGYGAIGLSILASLILQFVTVYNSTDLDDFGAIVNFKPMFGTYILKNLWKLYVLPYNRIPPYLIGVMTGHIMYRFKETKTFEIKQLANGELGHNKSSSFTGSHSNMASVDRIHHQSTTTIISATSDKASLCSNHVLGQLFNYLGIKIWTPIVFLISIVYLPMITRLATVEDSAAKLGTSSVIAIMRFTWSLAIARLVYICATRFLDNKSRNESFIIRFLSSPKWKPWSKIGLSALLIQWEIISYMAQIQTSAPNMTISFLLAMVLICIVTTYVLAVLIYLVLEYPLSQFEQLYLHPAIFGKR